MNRPRPRDVLPQRQRRRATLVVWAGLSTISLLPFASLGELRGYRRVFVGGVTVFTLGSLACALSGSLTALVISRVIQGFGGAGIMSVNNALLRFIYPADGLGRGIAINALVGSISAAIGPSVAAGILSVGPGNGCSRSMCRLAPSPWRWRGAHYRGPRSPITVLIG